MGCSLAEDISQQDVGAEGGRVGLHTMGKLLATLRARSTETIGGRGREGDGGGGGQGQGSRRVNDAEAKAPGQVQLGDIAPSWSWSTPGPGRGWVALDATSMLRPSHLSGREAMNRRRDFYRGVLWPLVRPALRRRVIARYAGSETWRRGTPSITRDSSAGAARAVGEAVYAS